MKSPFVFAVAAALASGCVNISSKSHSSPSAGSGASAVPAQPAAESGFVMLTDGKSFNGWTMAKEHPETWSIDNGAFKCAGERCHLFYTGPLAPFKDFELKVEVMTEPGSNGGIYFHTKYQDTGWPKYGFENQVNVTQGDWKKTGSLYDVMNLRGTPAEDNKWWTQHIIVKGDKVTVKIDGQTVLEYVEPSGHQAGADFTRKLDSGTFALQAHDPKSIVRYRNIRVKRL